jgi:hypothetical protein
MLSKDQIEEWERSEEYWSADKSVQKQKGAQALDPYDDAPVVEDAYKQDFSAKYSTKNFQSITDMVKDFMKVTGQKPDVELYSSLIDEEYDEWCFEDSLQSGEVSKHYGETYEATKELKELADLTYVIYAYAAAKGWDLEVAIQRVHKNNLARVVQPDGSIKKDHRGKILKRENAPKVYLKDLV